MFSHASRSAFSHRVASWHGSVAPLRDERFAWTSLIRQGQRPLSFMGRTLFDIAVNDPALSVSSDVTVHETDEQFLVAAIRHQLRGADGLSRHYAQRCDDIESALAFLHAHDPLCDLPVEALYAAAEGLDGVERHLAATACAGRLRQTWRQLLQTCFGTHQSSGELA
jgi:hypothetical protein